MAKGKAEAEEWFIKGQKHANAGEWKEALYCYEQGLRYDPNDLGLKGGRNLAIKQLGK